MGDQARFHFGGLGPLDLGAVIAVLERTGQAPDNAADWRELIDKLGVIHAARLEAIEAERERRKKDKGKGEAEPDDEL